MPLYYDNSVGYSEASLTLTYPRDWTENGVDTLTIWFRGSSSNAAETLYVALNGSAVVNHDNPDAAQTGRWTEWSIPLQAFADQGVNTLTIWFRGSAGNAAENLYVALNGNAVVNHDNPDAATKISWTAWNINLTRFADQGVNLANVNTITLGLGNKNNPVAGGSGMMYFDDIRLYAPAP